VYILGNGDRHFYDSYGIIADENDKATFIYPKEHVDISITITSSEDEFAYSIQDIETSSIVKNYIHKELFDSFEFSLVLPLNCYELEVYNLRDNDDEFHGFYKVLLEYRNDIFGFNYRALFPFWNPFIPLYKPESRVKIGQRRGCFLRMSC